MPNEIIQKMVTNPGLFDLEKEVIGEPRVISSEAEMLAIVIVFGGGLIALALGCAIWSWWEGRKVTQCPMTTERK